MNANSEVFVVNKLFHVSNDIRDSFFYLQLWNVDDRVFDKQCMCAALT